MLVQLDWLDVRRADPRRLVLQAVGESTLGVLLTKEQVDCFRVAEFDQCVRTHVWSVMRSGWGVYCPNGRSPSGIARR